MPLALKICMAAVALTSSDEFLARTFRRWMLSGIRSVCGRGSARKLSGDGHARAGNSGSVRGHWPGKRLGAGRRASSATHPGETADEDLAVLEAPVGHRQPGMGDLPGWLRQKEETGLERPEFAPGRARHAYQAKAGKAGRSRAVRGAADRHPIHLPRAAERSLTTQATTRGRVGAALSLLRLTRLC